MTKLGWGSCFLVLAVGTSVWASKKKEQHGEPGQFDFYVLSLSWSPQHCAERPDDHIQCGGSRPYTFILHGLWPQYERGFPSACSTGSTVDPNIVKGMLDIMPSNQLIKHEWAKHGTCSGLEPKAYFALARKAYEGFHIPATLKQPVTTINVKPSEFKTTLLKANPQLKNAELAIFCNGRFLQEVRVCLDKTLQPRACSSQVRDRCTVDEMIVRPLR